MIYHYFSHRKMIPRPEFTSSCGVKRPFFDQPFYAFLSNKFDTVHGNWFLWALVGKPMYFARQDFENGTFVPVSAVFRWRLCFGCVSSGRYRYGSRLRIPTHRTSSICNQFSTVASLHDHLFLPLNFSDWFLYMCTSLACQHIPLTFYLP